MLTLFKGCTHMCNHTHMGVHTLEHLTHTQNSFLKPLNTSWSYKDESFGKPGDAGLEPQLL